MSKPRYGWWGYVKDMIRRYPDDVNQNEKDAVDAAIAVTERMPNGQARLKVIDLVLWSETHRIPGAALEVPCSERTAWRWQSTFIKDTARNFKCDGLL